MSAVKDLAPSIDTIKTTIAGMVRKVVKEVEDPQVIKDDLSGMEEECIIPHDIAQWAIAEAQKVYDEMAAYEESDDIYTPKTPGVPVELGDDDLYQAAVCNYIINQSNEQEECKEFFQTLSRMSIERFSMTRFEDQAVFPMSMIAICSHPSSSNGKTCYVAFQDLKFRQLSTDAMKSTFGKGMGLMLCVCSVFMPCFPMCSS